MIVLAVVVGWSKQEVPEPLGMNRQASSLRPAEPLYPLH